MAKPRACDCCSRRKVRCDRNYPCENCVKAGLLCSYATKPKKRGPKGRTKVIQALKMLQQGNITTSPAATNLSMGMGMNINMHMGLPLASRHTWDVNIPATFGFGGASAAERDMSIPNGAGPGGMYTHTFDVERGVTPTSDEAQPNGLLSYSQNPCPRSQSFGATYYPDPLTGLPPHQPNPVFRPHTLLLSRSFALTCSNIYFERLYPVMPLFHRNSFIETYIDTFHSDPKVYALVAALCALTVIQLCAVPEEEEPPTSMQAQSDAESDSPDRRDSVSSRRSKTPEWPTTANRRSDPNLVTLQNYAQIFASISSSYTQQKPTAAPSITTPPEAQRVSAGNADSPCGQSSSCCALSLLGHGLISECLRARRYFDYISLSNTNLQCQDLSSSRTITDNVIASYFLFCCYGNLGKDSHAWYYLREACGFAIGCGMNDERSYQFTSRRLPRKRSRSFVEGEKCSAGVGGAERKEKVRMEHLKRKLFWSLFVSERGYAIHRHHPLSLRGGEVELPTVRELWSLCEGMDSEEGVAREGVPEETLAAAKDQFDQEKVILTNFVTLAKVFRNFDDTFVEVWNKLDVRRRRRGNTRLKNAGSTTSNGSMHLSETEEDEDDSEDEGGEDGIGFSSSRVEYLHKALERVLEEAGMGADGDKSMPLAEGEDEKVQGAKALPKVSPSTFLPGYTQQAELYFQHLPRRSSDPLERRRSLSLDGLSAIYKSSSASSSYSEKPKPFRSASMASATRPSSISFPTRSVESVIPIQKADILLSTQWLHLIIWQLSVARTAQLGKVKRTPAQKKDLMLPVQIAKQALEITARVGTETLEVHGIGMQEKLHDIGCALAAVIAVSSPPASPAATSASFTSSAVRTTKPSLPLPELYTSSSFQATPKGFLSEILRVLSNLRGGKSRYFEALLRKVDGVLDLSCPIVNGRAMRPLALPETERTSSEEETKGRGEQHHNHQEASYDAGKEDQVQGSSVNISETAHSPATLDLSEGMDLDPGSEATAHFVATSQAELPQQYPMLHAGQSVIFDLEFEPVDTDMKSEHGRTVSPEHRHPFHPDMGSISQDQEPPAAYIQDVHFDVPYPYPTPPPWISNIHSPIETAFLHQLYVQNQPGEQPNPHHRAPLHAQHHDQPHHAAPPNEMESPHPSSPFGSGEYFNNMPQHLFTAGAGPRFMPGPHGIDQNHGGAEATAFPGWPEAGSGIGMVSAKAPKSGPEVATAAAAEASSSPGAPVWSGPPHIAYAACAIAAAASVERHHSPFYHGDHHGPGTPVGFGGYEAEMAATSAGY